MVNENMKEIRTMDNAIFSRASQVLSKTWFQLRLIDLVMAESLPKLDSFNFTSRAEPIDLVPKLDSFDFTSRTEPTHLV